MQITQKYDYFLFANNNIAYKQDKAQLMELWMSDAQLHKISFTVIKPKDANYY